MGNENGAPVDMTETDASKAHRQNLRELQDLSSNYLDHLELIIDSRHTMDDPRDVIMVLKSNLKTAREQINKISSSSTKFNPQSINTNHNDSPISNGHNHHNKDSPLLTPNNYNNLQLAPTDSDSTNASSFLSKFPPLNGRNTYDWSNANIEQIYFDQCDLGKINGIQIATSTFDPVIMATVSQDGKCRIWKLRKKSNQYEILYNDRKVHQAQLFEIDSFLLHSSQSREIKEAENMANVAKSKKNSKKTHKKRSGKRRQSIDSETNENFLNSSLNSDPSSASYNNLRDAMMGTKEKYIRKDLRFELCHEIQLSSTWIMCVAMHHEGNLVAVGGLDTNVTIYDITSYNEEDNEFLNTKNKKRESSGSSTERSDFQIDGKNILLSQLTFWEEYISCIEFLNDDQHLIVGSGDGTATICNYVTQTKLFALRADTDVISIDYLYLDAEDFARVHSWNRGKSPPVPSNRPSQDNGNNDSSSKKQKKKKWHQKRPRFKKSGSNKKKGKDKGNENKISLSPQLSPDNSAGSNSSANNSHGKNVKFDGVPVVADFDDGIDSDSSSDNNKPRTPQRFYERESRHILLMIGTSSTKWNNIFIDDYILNLDENDKKIHSEQFKEKHLIKEKVKFSKSLQNKKCESVKFSPNGKYFAVGGEACLYQIYNRETMKLIHERSTKDGQDIHAIQRRPNLAAEYEKKRLQVIKDEDPENKDRDEEDEYFVTCITWINDYTVAVGNNKGAFIYISTILHEYKIRNFVLKEVLRVFDEQSNICDDELSLMNADNIIDEIHDFIGYDVIDNVIETNFGDRTSCLTSHPYFEMRPIDLSNNNHKHRSNTTASVPSTPVSYLYSRYNKKEGLCVSGSWSSVFQGCVLKG